MGIARWAQPTLIDWIVANPVGEHLFVPVLARGGSTYEGSSRSRVHPGGTPGRDRHHWHFDRVVVAGGAHNGSLPASLQSLVDAGQIQAEVLRSPRTPSPAGRPFYIYIAGQTTQQKDPALTIVAHEDPDQTREGVNALFLDGHVEFIRHEAFWERLEQTYKRLGREMPK